MTNQLTEFECKNLALKLGDKTLFQDFDFKFSGPGIVMVEGENGTGKSSFLKVLAGFIISDNGHVSYSELPPDQISARDFSYFTTTSLGLLNDLTGLEHVEIISKALKVDPTKTSAKLLEFQELEIFKEVLIKRVADFSQGMKQVLRLFLHLFFEPRILFLDEPFLYLSPKLKEYFQQKIELLASNSLVFVTDQKFFWSPNAKNSKVVLGVK